MARKVHFMGIGGVGMAGVAYLLHRRGDAVSGCDAYASPRTQWLERVGIPVAIGHDAAHLAGQDELIVTPAVPPSASERAVAVACGVTISVRGEVLARLVNETDGIAVCGTHGKTTTATFTAKLLAALGDDPSWCIGGECGEMPVAHAGNGPLVVEADESDGTLALYRARTLVITQIDYDHPEHFPTRDAYRACFAQAAAQASDVIEAWKLNPDDWPELAALVTGRHNLLNARTAIEVALRRGHTRAEIAAALPSAVNALPDRRFQRVFPLSSAPAPFSVFTDYAHHPAELTCAVEMAASLKPRRLRVLFQPHRYTRTARLCADFPAAFAAADETVLIPVYAAFEQPVPGGDIADLYKAFRDQGHSQVKLARSAEEAWRHVFLTLEPGDLILLAGAGDIIRLVPRIQADLARPLPVRHWKPLAPFSFFRTGGATCGGGKPHFAGMGSNTWFSDCATDAEIVPAPVRLDDAREAVPAGLPGATLGIPWMIGIPGTVGGWVRMNAGAFGHSVSECVRRVREDGVWRAAHDCGFSYRHSDLHGFIDAVEFDIPDFGDETPASYRARRRTFPARTCGSVFKNPSPEQPAGRLLEEAGAKSLSVGGAAVWAEHANVIVAGEGCTSSDILALARLMARAVFFKTGIRLEPEIRGLTVREP